MDWTLKLEGGPYDGTIVIDVGAHGYTEPQPVLICWRCSDDPECEGHFTFNPELDRIELATAMAYKRVDLRAAEREADYEVGLDGGDRGHREELEIVGAGFGPLGGRRIGRVVRRIGDDDGTVWVDLG